LLQRYQRAKTYLSFERLRSASDPTSKASQQLKETCVQFIEQTIEHDALRKLVTPSHSVFCKRPVQSNDFYPALTRHNVELVPQAVSSVTPGGIVDATGVERKIDVLVMATGFDAANYLATFDVKGRGGASLHETWGSEPSAFLGVAMPGFPNFYMLYGPGSNGGSIIFKLERQAEWITRVVKRMRRWRLTTVEVKPAVHRRFNAWLDRENAKRAWGADDCHNYFTSPSGRIITQWPGSMTLYWFTARVLNRVATTSERLPARGKHVTARQTTDREVTPA
jgi:cation diffusion facilitator CzcD-associated flavoprotein CzcO